MKNKILKNISFESLQRSLARKSHLEFMEYTWMERALPFYKGIHTHEICKEVDYAFSEFRAGRSYFGIIEVCFRHGKSQIASRYLPPHFLGEFPDSEVLITTHSAGLAYKFSRYSRNLIQSPKYKELYPDIRLSKKSSSVSVWEIDDHTGKAQYAGINAGNAGLGGGFIGIDDFFGKREDAESPGIRDKIWESFTDNIMTRRADPSIVFVTATPWHVDDIIGRIKKKMASDPKFPRFRIKSFPAQSERYETGYLFPERFSRDWYDAQRTMLGVYGSRSLMDCDPAIKGGNKLNVGKVKYYDNNTVMPWHQGRKVTWYRGWDIASTEKETDKNDPDWTVGMKIGIVMLPTAINNLRIPQIFIDDVVRFRHEGLKRQEIMAATAMADGPEVTQRVESVGVGKDAFTMLRTTMRGLCHVEPVNASTDKITKSMKIQPVFDAGNVYINNKAWSDELISELGGFPNSAHDDQADALMIAFGDPNNIGRSVDVR
jgi:predicted phage terminase large subunit-like protein